MAEVNPQVIKVAPADGGDTQAPKAEFMSDTSRADVAALISCNKVKVKQKASLAEAVTNGMCEISNKYKIKAKGGSGDGKTLYKAKEKSTCFQRQCCAPGHEATVEFRLDDVGEEDKVVYTMYKPFKCANCYSCFSICRSEMIMYQGKWKIGDEDGVVLGSAKEITCGGVFTPTLDVFDHNGDKKGQMKGPTCLIGSCCDTSFKFTPEGADGPSDTEIKKEGADGAEDMAKELLTDADTFKIEFDKDMDEAQRATMMGTQLLLDFMFFEGDGACDVQHCEVKLFDWFCCGVTIPCKLKCSNSEGGD